MLVMLMNNNSRGLAFSAAEDEAQAATQGTHCTDRRFALGLCPSSLHFIYIFRSSSLFSNLDNCSLKHLAFHSKATISSFKSISPRFFVGTILVYIG